VEKATCWWLRVSRSSAEPTWSAALITGACGGIGEELAKLFASSGHDVVLVARSESKLDSLGQSLSVGHGIRASAISAD
jgi:hypothetical protein